MTKPLLPSIVARLDMVFGAPSVGGGHGSRTWARRKGLSRCDASLSLSGAPRADCCSNGSPRMTSLQSKMPMPFPSHDPIAKFQPSQFHHKPAAY